MYTCIKSVCKDVCVCILTYLPTYMHTYTTYVHTYMHACIHTYIWLHVCVCFVRARACTAKQCNNFDEIPKLILEFMFA